MKKYRIHITLSLILAYSISSFSQKVTIKGNILIDRAKLNERDDTLRLRPVSSLYYPEQSKEWTIKIPIDEHGSFFYEGADIKNDTFGKKSTSVLCRVSFR